MSSPPFSKTLQASAGIDKKQRSEVAKKLGKRQEQVTPCDVVASQNCYGTTLANLDNLPATSAGFAAVVSSPPFSETVQAQDPKYQIAGNGHGPRHSDYGNTPGQLGAMRAGEFDAVISTPPFGAGETRDRTPYQDGAVARMMIHAYTQNRQGTMEGNLAAMPATAGAFDAVVSSPPYEASVKGGGKGIDFSKTKRDGDVSYQDHSHSPGTGQFEYSKSKDNLGNQYGDDFWSAAHTIIAKTFAVLRLGGHAVWVVKDFGRNGKRVQFCNQWRQLCEACGFVTLHEHHAMLVIDNGTQLATDGRHKRNRKERKSFFRRLAEKKGSPAIDYEVVLWMEKPNR